MNELNHTRTTHTITGNKFSPILLGHTDFWKFYASLSHCNCKELLIRPLYIWQYCTVICHMRKFYIPYTRFTQLERKITIGIRNRTHGVSLHPHRHKFDRFAIIGGYMSFNNKLSIRYNAIKGSDKGK